MDHKITTIQPFGLLLEANQSLDKLDDLNVDQLCELVWREHLIVLRGFRTFHDAESGFCGRQWHSVKHLRLLSF